MAFKKLRKYQRRHQTAILKALHTLDSVLYNAPTGAGKSTVVTSVIGELAKGDWNGAVVTVPMTHIRDSFTKNGAGASGLFESQIYGKHSKSKVRLFETWVRKHWQDRAFAAVVCRQTFEQASLPSDLTGWVLFVDEAHGSSVEVNEETTRLSEYRKRWRERGGIEVVVSATPYRSNGQHVYDEFHVQVRRSIAEHSLPDEEGNRYAPSNFEVQAVGLPGYRVRTKDELYGDQSPRRIGPKAIKKMIAEWARDGYPKAIFLVPPGESGAWSFRVAEALRQCRVPYRKGSGAVIHNAVGTGKVFQEELIALLDRERDVEHVEGSEVDAIVACARFNEGTDWPLCSHVYQVGFPKSIQRTNQRWGRAFRSKAEIVKHPHPETARITFFVPEFAKSLLDQMQVAKFERAHLRMALLMAGHLEDHKAGQMLVSMIQEIFKINTPRAPLHVDLDDFQSQLQPTDEELLAVNVAFKHLQPHAGGLTMQALDHVADAFNLDERGRMLLRIRAVAAVKDDKVREELLKILHRAYLKMFKPRPVPKGSRSSSVAKPMDIIPGEFIAMFDEYVVKEHQGKIGFDPPMSKKHWRMVSRFTGRDAKAVDQSMRKMVGVLHDWDRIKDGIAKYWEEHGKAPTDSSGDAEPYVDYPATWKAINAWIKANEAFVLDGFVETL